MAMQKAFSYYQKPPKNGPAMSTGDYKRTLESLVDTVFKAGGLFAFGTKLMEPILAGTGAAPAETIATYMAMDLETRKPFDLVYKDRVVGLLMVKGNKYTSMRRHLMQAQLQPGVECVYPIGGNATAEMMDNGAWIEDKKTAPRKPGGPNPNPNPSPTGGTVGAIVQPIEEQQEEEEEEEEELLELPLIEDDEVEQTGVRFASDLPDLGKMGHILAMIEAESNNMECSNYFDPLDYQDNFEDDGIIGAIIGEHEVYENHPVGQIPHKSYEEEGYKVITVWEEYFKKTLEWEDRLPKEARVDKRINAEIELFTGGPMIHPFGIDPLIGELCDKEIREHARRSTTYSPDSSHSVRNSAFY